MTLAKIKDQERKATTEKETVTYKGVPTDYQLISLEKPCRQEGAGKKYERQRPTSKIALSSKAII